MTIDATVVIAAFGALVTALGAVARRIYADLKADRDYWRSIALELMVVNNKAVDVAAAHVTD